VRLVSKDLQLWRLRERAVETGPGGEAVDEAWPVLHPFEPGFTSTTKVIQALLGEIGQGSLQVRPDRFGRASVTAMSVLIARQPAPAGCGIPGAGSGSRGGRSPGL
jgi:hypothetical protein